MSTRSRSTSLLVAVALAAGAAAAQGDPALLGRWVGISAANKDEKLLIEKDVITVLDRRVPYKVPSVGVLLIGDEEPERATYRIQGDELVLTMADESQSYKREAAAKVEGKPKDADGAGTRPANPLAGKPAADPFARSFQGDNIALELDGDAAKGYRGKLVFQEITYAAEATADGTNLRGRFQAGENWFDFSATLAADQLTLESAGKTYQLTGARPAPAAPANPLGKTEGAAGEAGTPPPLEGVFAGKATRFEHPRGWFGFDMPEGWTVYQQADTGMLLNPGLTPTDTLDAIVGLMWGRLEPQDQNQPVAKVIEKHLPELRQGLAQQGMTVSDAAAKITVHKGKDVPGAVTMLSGQTPDGKKLQVWFGGIVKRDSWIAISGVVLAGKEEVYLPKVKRIFSSLEPRPPERNAKLEAALAGRTFSSSQYGKNTGSAHHASYGFAAGGVVTRRLMSNIPSQPGLPGAGVDSERGGRFEVCGDVLYLYFETGQEAGQVLVEGGQVAGIRLGTAQDR